MNWKQCLKKKRLLLLPTITFMRFYVALKLSYFRIKVKPWIFGNVSALSCFGVVSKSALRWMIIAGPLTEKETFLYIWIGYSKNRTWNNSHFSKDDDRGKFKIYRSRCRERFVLNMIWRKEQSGPSFFSIHRPKLRRSPLRSRAALEVSALLNKL